MNKTRFMVQGAAIAGIYAALTIALAPISYGQVQVRVAEALMVLPYFTPAAIPGLFVGCLIANMVAGLGLLDIVFGSLATLIAAAITYKIRNKKLVPLPAVIVNGLIIGYMLYYLFQLPLLATILWVGFGELIACYAIGYPLLNYLERYKKKIFEL